MRRLAILGMALLALTAPGLAAAQSMVGTWSGTVNWDQPSGLMITSSFTQDGRVQSTTQNHQGQSFLLSGYYQFDPNQGVLRFRWADYAPKQLCSAVGCQALASPAPLGVESVSQIRFLNANQFVATLQGGSTVYVRTDAAGYPTR